MVSLYKEKWKVNGDDDTEILMWPDKGKVVYPRDPDGGEDHVAMIRDHNRRLMLEQTLGRKAARPHRPRESGASSHHTAADSRGAGSSTQHAAPQGAAGGRSNACSNCGFSEPSIEYECPFPGCHKIYTSMGNANRHFRKAHGQQSNPSREG